VTLLAALAYYILQLAIMADQGPNSKLRAALGRDLKGKISPIFYVSGIILAFLNHWIAVGLYACVALMWLIPDRRIESMLVDSQ
jgi:uncharacterized membrane protein